MRINSLSVPATLRSLFPGSSSRDANAMTNRLRLTHLWSQVEVDVDLFGDQAVYLTDGLEVTASMYNGQPAACSTPITVTLPIEQTDPHMKGESAAKSYKPATLSNGTTVMVPAFMQAGDLVVVNTQDGTFVKRGSKG